MKKLLLILCALVCGTLAFAQTAGSYTDNLHLTVNETDEGVQQGTVTVEYQNDDKTIIDFTLHELSVEIYMDGWMTLYLGDVTVYDIELGEEVDGVATFSCTDDHDVAYPDLDSDFTQMVSDVSVNMTGDLSETKLHANMEITVSLSLMGLIPLGDYVITATFGYDYGEYLIVNAANGNYLGGGLDWGTHATETDKPQFFSFIQQADGTYLLNGHQANSTSLGLDADEAEYYIDAVNPHSWVFEEADDGSGYYIGDDDGYLVGNGIYVAVNTTNRKANSTVWKLVTMDDVLATMDGASISNPVDVTPLIPAPEPKYNSYKDSWTATGYNETAEPNNYCFGGNLGWNASTPLCESYHSTNGFDVRQTISSLPVGYYELTAQAFYRNDGGTVVPSMYITTGTCATDGGYIEKVHLPEHYTSSEDMNGAYEEFLEKLYPVTLPFIVDAEGEEFTVGFESNVEDNDQMWSIFGELSLTYLGTDLPTLEVVSGTMNVNVEAAMTAAVATYNSNKTLDNFIAAEEAIIDAEESIAHYEEIAVALASGEYEAVLSTFDEAGQAAFQTDFIEAYEALTLTNETVEDGLAAACKKQTTEFSDMTYALKNSGEWVNAISATSFQLCPQLPTAHEVWSASVWNLGRDVLEKEAIYKQIEDLPAGTYTLSFYAYGSEASDITSKRPLAYATGAEDQEVAYISALGEAWTSASLYTFICEVGEDGILEFGMKSQGEGNWYVMEEYSLIYGAEEEDPYTYNITALLSNPSFEVDDPATEGWDVDYDDSEGSTPRATAADGKGAWTIPIADGKPTGWTITEIAEVCDLMTKEAAATDNGLGSPGEAAEGDYMLYMKKTWGDTDNATVVQTIVLPAGEYKFTVDSKFFSGGATAKLVVGDESEDIHVNATTATTDILSETAWTTNTLTFTLDETTELTIGVQMSFPNTSPGSILLDNFQLWCTEDVEIVVPEPEPEPDPYIYDITERMANPSFEDVDVADLTVDADRCDAEEGGAWKVTSLEGWGLVAPAHSNSGYPVSDIMSAAATATDNNYGVPGEPSDETYMLYLRNAHAEQNGDDHHLDDASVMQSVVLPAGQYKVTVDSKCVANDTAAGTVTLVAGDESTALTIHVTENGTEDTAGNPFLDAWDTAVLEFSLTETTEVTLGVNIEYTDGSENYPLSVLLDNFTLWSTEPVDDYVYDVTKVLSNPSFEDVDVEELDVDGTRCDTTIGGAWTIDSLEGWDLAAPTQSSPDNAAYAVSDIMSAAATATDNGFGAPGTPSDGTYMLYLRESHTSWGGAGTSASVLQGVVLPAGEYKVTVDSKCVASMEAAETVNLVVGEESTPLTIHADSTVPADWDTAVLTFSLTETTEVSLGVAITYDSANDLALSVLLDNFKLWSTTDIPETTIEWELAEVGWGTMIIPFDAELPEGMIAYAGDAITINDTELELGDEATSIEANVPYLVTGDVGTYTFTGIPTNTADSYNVGVLVGTLVDMAYDDENNDFTPNSGQYVLQSHTEGGLAFYQITENSKGVKLAAYHCYLTTTNSLSVLSLPGMATGIEAVESDLIANDAIYDLSGRKVSKAVKGVYIINGKKVLVK